MTFKIHLSANDPELPNIKAVMNEIEEPARHTIAEVDNQTSGCIVCVKSYGEVREEKTGYCLQRTTEPGETPSERQMERQEFLAGLQRALVTFIPRGVSQAGGCHGARHSINNENVKNFKNFSIPRKNFKNKSSVATPQSTTSKRQF